MELTTFRRRPRPFVSRPRLEVCPLEDRIVPTVAIDVYESNDTRQTATYLGRGGSLNWVSMSIHSSTDVDWLAFRIDNAGVAGNTVGINFTHANGDLDIELEDAAGNYLSSSTGTVNNESISLQRRPAGTYYIRVYGSSGAINPNYAMTFVTPTGNTLGNDASR